MGGGAEKKCTSSVISRSMKVSMGTHLQVGVCLNKICPLCEFYILWQNQNPHIPRASLCAFRLALCLNVNWTAGRWRVRRDSPDWRVSSKCNWMHLTKEGWNILLLIKEGIKERLKKKGKKICFVNIPRWGGGTHYIFSAPGWLCKAGGERTRWQ